MYRSALYQWLAPILLRAFGPVHVFLYRLLRGHLVGHVSQGFMPVLLLTSIGRRTGRRRTQPLGYVRDGDKLLIVASNGALVPHPSWFFNLRSHREADVQLGDRRMRVRATILDGDERSRAWSTIAARYRFFDTYQRSVSRRIPILRLEPLSEPVDERK